MKDQAIFSKWLWRKYYLVNSNKLLFIPAKKLFLERKEKNTNLTIGPQNSLIVIIQPEHNIYDFRQIYQRILIIKIYIDCK